MQRSHVFQRSQPDLTTGGVRYGKTVNRKHGYTGNLSKVISSQYVNNQNCVRCDGEGCAYCRRKPNMVQKPLGEQTTEEWLADYDNHEPA